MKGINEIDIMRDLLYSKINNQERYNEDSIVVRNPELRNLLITLRDDDMRDIILLQQKIERLKPAKGIISKILPSRNKI